MKIPKPGVDLFLPFFWSSRLRFSVFRGESCYSGPVPYTGLFSLSLFLPGFKMSHTKQPFFSISPFPCRTTWTDIFFLNCFFDWCWVCEGVWFADDVIWFFFHTISSVLNPLIEEDKIWMWPFETHFSSYIPPIACSFFCISRWWLIYQRWILVFLLRVMTDRRWNAPTLSTTPQKAFEKKQLAFC